MKPLPISNLDTKKPKSRFLSEDFLVIKMQEKKKSQNMIEKMSKLQKELFKNIFSEDDDIDIDVN